MPHTRHDAPDHGPASRWASGRWALPRSEPRAGPGLVARLLAGQNRHMRVELPTGTVTFLFTDIEGSTRLLREFGDGYAEVLAEHRRALRDAWRRHDGVEVDTQGDAFFVAFARASDAVAAAADAQRALADGPVRVRMGLHTGEPVAVRRGICRFRRAPSGADRGRRARRAGAALTVDRGPRRRRCARPRPPPAEGPECARASLPARDGRLPPAEDAARDEPAGSGDAVPRPRAGDRPDRGPCCADPTSGW